MQAIHSGFSSLLPISSWQGFRGHEEAMGVAELIETWTLYAIGSLVIFARIGCRLRMIGLSGFKPDDYIIIFSWATYTVMTVAAHIVGGLGDLHALTMEQREALSEEEATPLIYATQWFCAGVATYILFIWTLKMNMLFLYQRVVRGLWVERFIKPTMYLVIATFIAIYMILFCVCRPYNRMWVVFPDQGEYCQPQSRLNMIPPLVMNIVTDLVIMLIPAPVLVNIQTTVWKKIGLLVLFTAGFFIMVAAIIRVTMVLILKNGPTAAIWSCREDFVAISIGQAILVRPMFTKGFWTNKYRSKGGYLSKPSKNSGDPERSFEMYNNRGRKSKNNDPFSITVALATVMGNETTPPNGSPNGSTEQIFNSAKEQTGPMNTIDENSAAFPEDVKQSPRNYGSWDGIHVSKTVTVENTEHGPETWQRMYTPSDSLQSTNKARAWNETGR
ncbi:hypothetical protein SCARD494_05543 [Seiridium cardinale]